MSKEEIGNSRTIVPKSWLRQSPFYSYRFDRITFYGLHEFEGESRGRPSSQFKKYKDVLPANAIFPISEDRDFGIYTMMPQSLVFSRRFFMLQPC